MLPVSTDKNGRPVRAGTGDPAFDIQFVEEEFDLWLESIIGRDWSKTAREAESQGQNGTADCQALIGSCNKREDDHKCRTSIRLT